MHLGGERGRQRARDCSPASRIPRNPALALSLNLRPPACCPATRLPLKHSALSVLEYQILRKFWSSFFFSQHRSNCRFGVVKAKPGLRPWSQRERAHTDMATAPRRAPQRRRGSVSAEVMAPPAPGLSSFAAENKGFGCGPIRCSDASVKATMPPDEQRCARSAHT